MKKAIFIFLTLTLLFMVGCQSVSEDNAVDTDEANTDEAQITEQDEKNDKPDKEGMQPDKEGMQPPEGGKGEGGFNINIDDLDTTDFSQEQLDMIEKYKNEEITVDDLISSDLFTREELGMEDRGGMLPPQENLNLDGLSDEQLEVIEKLYDGEITMEELSDSFTDSEIESIGFRGAKMGPGQEPEKK